MLKSLRLSRALAQRAKKAGASSDPLGNVLTPFTTTEFFSHSGACIARSPLFNKGTGYPVSERELMNMRGLLPHRVESLEEQASRAMHQLSLMDQPIQKYVYLTNLQNTNQTLFYKILVDNLEELMPIVYTPTVGEGCQRFSEQWRVSQGLFLTPDDRGDFAQLLDNWSAQGREQVDIVVVSDGSRILGLGDLGCNGMGIPVGKLSLYVAAAGFHPSRTLPVLLDFGTNNEKLLDDPYYLGYRSRRLEDEEFFPAVEEFMLAVKERWPRALVQFEDFSTDHAFQLLAEYRNRQLCFNDDVQGTGAVIAAGVLNASRTCGRKISENKFVFLGAGSSGTGVADVIARMMVEEDGISESEARKRFYLVDSKGLVCDARGDTLAAHKIPYSRKEGQAIRDLEDVVKQVKPTALIGLSGTEGRPFNQSVLTSMAEFNEKPIVFALSNPTSRAECTFEDAVHHTQGRVVWAAGSPFDPVKFEGVDIVSNQGNNMYIFPGLGLGAVLSGASVVSDRMISAAIKSLAHSVVDADVTRGILYPPLQKIRMISAKIAGQVAEAAYEEGIASVHPKPQKLQAFARGMMFEPRYLPVM